MGMMDIRELAEPSGVPPSALRYYEELGLIRSISRHGLRRQFDADVLLTLSLIELGRTAVPIFPGISCTPRRMICIARWSTCERCGICSGTWPNVQLRRIWNARPSASL